MRRVTRSLTVHRKRGTANTASTSTLTPVEHVQSGKSRVNGDAIVVATTTYATNTRGRSGMRTMPPPTQTAPPPLKQNVLNDESTALTRPSEVTMSQPPTRPPNLLKILIVNVVHKKKINDYVYYATENEYDLMCMNEAVFNEKAPRDASLILYEDKSTRIAVKIIDKRLKYEEAYTSPYQVTLKLGEPKVHVTFWYIPPGSSAPTALLDELETALSKKSRGRIHTGDFNARSVHLGDKSNNERGNRMWEAVSKGQFVVINQVGTPTFISRGMTSIVDWTCVSPDLVDRVEWQSHPAALGSDHEFIELRVNTLKSKRERVTSRKIKPAIWLNKIHETTKGRSFDTWHEDFSAAVDAAKKITTKRDKDDDDQKAAALRKTIHYTGQKIKRGEGVEAVLRQQIREATDELKEHRKNQQLNDRINRIKTATEMTLYKDLINKTKDTASCEYVIVEGRRLAGLDAAKALLDKFYPTQQKQRWILPKQLPPDDPPITMTELRQAIKEYKGGKAPGDSGVSMELIKQWFIKESDYVHGLIDSWFTQGIFPEQLKKVTIKPLLKNKSKQSTVDNVRPITLSESLARLYEKILDNRIMHFVEKNQTLSEAQFGYREMWSAVKLADEITKQRIENSGLDEVTLQLDVKSAFDAVTHLAVIKSLVEYKLPGNLVKIISNYLTDRKVTVKLDGAEYTKNMDRGVPQGSCIGPHLYTLVTNAMLKTVTERMKRNKLSQSHVYSYADDIILLVASDRGREFITKCADNYLKIITNELEKVGLSVAPEKTKIMYTSRNATHDTVQIAGKEIITSNHLKLLGMYFSHNKMTIKHVQMMEEKLDNWMKAQQGLFSPSSGLSYELRKKAVLSVLFPKLTYGAEVWWKSIGSTGAAVLKRISRKAAVAITAASLKTSYMAAATMSKTLPLDVVCEKRTRIHDLFESTPHEKRVKKYERGHPSETKTRTFGATINTQEEVEAVDADVKFFTDGSKYDSDGIKTGAAYVRYPLVGEAEVCLMKLTEVNSVFQAEVVAIKAVLQDIVMRQDWCLTHAIFSDSLSAIQAITGQTSSFQLVDECRKLLDLLESNQCEVKLYHVKAHVGIEQNEQADKMAKYAATHAEVEQVPASRAELANAEKKLVNHEYERRMQLEPAGSTLRHFFSGPFDPRLKQVTIDRDTTAIYSGLAYNKTSRLYGNVGQEEMCKCGKIQTIKHLIQECPLTRESNIQAATASGLPLDVLLDTWEQLSAHKKFHRFISYRARSLISDIKIINEDDITLYKQIAELAKTNISAETKRRSSKAARKDEPNWFSKLNVDDICTRKTHLYSDQLAEEFQTPSKSPPPAEQPGSTDESD